MPVMGRPVNREADRRIVLLRDQGLSLAEIAEREGVSRSAVCQRLRRIRERRGSSQGGAQAQAPGRACVKPGCGGYVSIAGALEGRLLCEGCERRGMAELTPEARADINRGRRLSGQRLGADGVWRRF